MLGQNSFRFVYIFVLFMISGAGVAFAGGLSGEVARQAMCEDVLVQCMSKVKNDFPCEGLAETACRDKRYAAEKQCNFLYSHCNEGPPVKHAKPVKPGKKEH